MEKKPILQRARAIEREFDEPLRDVVAGFADMGYSRRLVADALDVTFESLKHFNRREGIHFPRAPLEKREIRGRPRRMIRHAGREMGLSEWAAEFGVAPCTIHKRLRTRGRIA